MPDRAVETGSSGFFAASPALPLPDCLASGLNKRFRQTQRPHPRICRREAPHSWLKIDFRAENPLKFKNPTDNHNMRKSFLALALALCGGFTLAAQNRVDASILVSPVVGSGSRAEDNTLFYKQLVFEVTDQKFNLAKTQSGADYSLVGTLAPYMEPSGDRQYVFHLELRDNSSGRITVEGDMLYKIADDSYHLFPILVSTLLYTIPEGTGINDDWRNQMLYLGGSAFWNPTLYVRDGNISPNLVNFGLGVSAEYHFLNYMSLEAGVEGTLDWVKLEYSNRIDNYRNLMIQVPLLLKLVFKPSTYFMIEPYVGGQFNFGLFKNTEPYLFSGLVGFQYGVKAGSGVFFVDLRAALDLGRSGLINTKATFARGFGHLSLGYKYGVLGRKAK
jgi:hypothetical protein